MSTVFTKIINREIPGRFVYEDDLCVAFLDISPQATGHTLVVPREEIDQWTDLSDELTAHLFAVAQKVGRAQVEAFNAKRAGLMIVGFDVPHAHIHVFPTSGDLKDFEITGFNPAPDKDLDAAHAALLAAMEKQV
jgi:histidine triad (HIT) family protein